MLINQSFSILFLQHQDGCKELGTFASFFEEQGYEIDYAQQLNEAEALLCQYTYDIFIIDDSHISKDKCLNLIKRLEGTPIHIIMISDHLNNKCYQKVSDIGKVINN